MTKNFAGNHSTSGIGLKDHVLEARIFREDEKKILDRLIKDSEAAMIIGVSKATWWRRVADGTMPQPIRIGSSTRWKLSEVVAVIEKLAKARPSPPMMATDITHAQKSLGSSNKTLRKKEAN